MGEAFPRLPMQEICPSAGYLCPDGGSGEEYRVRRWPDATGTLVVQVPRPPLLPGEEDRGRALQRAVAQGILIWDGHPFRIRIQDREMDLEGGLHPQRKVDLEREVDGAAAAPAPDIRIEWVDRLEESRLGRVRTRWSARGTETEFAVERFELALTTRGGALTPELARRSAGHEMGHALGLEHSDDPRDLMYPENRALNPSTRDYLTLNALYGLPEGALLVR